jgi:hypothetical protein
VHCINNGERALSRKLNKAGFFPFCLYSAISLYEAVQQLLNAEYDKIGPIKLGPISELLPHNYGDGTMSGTAYTYRAAQRALFRAGKSMQVHNPTHVCALIMNVALNAPVKRDLCYRGGVDMVHLIAQVKGFTQFEKVMMANDLRKRGFPASIIGLQRILYNWGRV